MIFLLILKWIGLILAGLIVLLLLLCACILFIPVRYRIKAEYEGDVTWQVSFSWLFHMLTVKAGSNITKVRLRLFGIPIKTLYGQDIKKEKEPKQSKVMEEPSVQETEVVKEPVADAKEPTIEPMKEQTQKKKRKKKKKAKTKKKSFSFGKISSIIDFIRDKNNKRAFTFLKNELLGLIHHVSVRRCKVFISYGFTDPRYTGLVTGLVSMFPVASRKGVVVHPDFTDQCLVAKGDLKGRMYVNYACRLFLRVYRNQDVKQLYQKIKN